MAEGAVRFDGAVVSAPMLGLRLGGRPILPVKAVATLMGLLGLGARPTPAAIPNSAGSDLAGSDLPGSDLLGPDPSGEDNPGGNAFTHDAKRWARVDALLHAHPELRIGEPTWGWLQFAFALMHRLEAMRRLEAIAAPVAIVAAERDAFVLQAPQKTAAARLPHGRYAEVPGAFHEILIETDARRAVFWETFDALAADVAP